MAGTVKLDIHLTIAGTDRAAQFTAFNVEVDRTRIDDARFRDKSGRILLGAADIVIRGHVKWDSDLTFKKAIINAHEDDAEVAFVFRSANAAKGLNNLEIAGSFKVPKLPRIGATRNEADEEDFEWPVNTALTIDDGTTVYTIG